MTVAVFFLPSWLTAQSIIVAYSTGDSAAIVDPTALRVLATIPTGNAHEIAVTRDGRMVFLGSTGRRDSLGPASIAVVDVASRSVARRLRIPMCAGLHDIRLSRDETILWVACGEMRTILGVSTVDGVERERWDTHADGSWMLTSTPDDRKLYVPNLEGTSVSIIDRIARTVRVSRLGGAMLGAAVTPDGREAWLTNADSSIVTILDVSRDSVIAAFRSSGRGPVRVQFTPDGARAVLSNDGSRDVTIMDARARQRLHSVALDAAPKVLAVSPDGTRAVVSHPAARKIAVIDVVRGRLIGYVPVTGVADGVGWTR